MIGTSVPADAAHGRQRRTADYRTRVSIMWLIALSFTLPRGIGPSIHNIPIDLTKLTLLLSVVLVLHAKMRNLLAIRHHTSHLSLVLATCLLFSGSWLVWEQYFIFAYYLVMYVSALWVAEYLFRDSEFFAKFTNTISLLLIISGIIALLDHHLHFIPFDLLRSQNRAFVHTYSRGFVFGSIEIPQYKGFDVTPAWFAMNRFVWFAWGIIAYTFLSKKPAPNFHPRILLGATLLGLFEILYSQARVTTIAALMLFAALMASLLFKKERNLPRAIGIIALLTATTIAGARYFMLFLQNIYSVIAAFNILHLPQIESGLIYNFAVDKRGQALMGLWDNYASHEAYLPSGPLFYNYTRWFLDVPAEFFDDLTPLINSVFEIGLVPWLLMCLFVAYVLSKKVDRLGGSFKIILLLTCASALGIFSPRFYYYFFFALGAILSRQIGRPKSAPITLRATQSP